VDSFIDFIGEALMVLAFVNPLVAAFFIWKIKKLTITERIFIIIIASIILFVLLFGCSMSIIFRNGMAIT